MRKYFVITSSSYPNLEMFSADIVGILNSNFSNTSENEENTLKSMEAKNLLTFPEQPLSGQKYLILRATGEAICKPEGDRKFFVGSDGTVNPPKAEYEGQDNYWEMTDNWNMGHHVLPLTAQILKDTRYFVAESGSSGSVITVEIALDRFRKPQVAICRLTTPEDYVGFYAKHFLGWAASHNKALKDGKW